ncbi:MAG: glycosyltransferase family 2 protein [Lachnospiraceae bacterium]|nr:glycosyltransferase family 2 protein [Lachnospiraceae bacterium]
MKELISVIVPVHNSEKYLTQCIESIINQSYQELEIILVDDCSTDRSAAICDQYAQTDQRIHVIHKTVKGGEGGARARNEGIAAATGDIFYFIDSDDYIEHDMLANMSDIMEREHSECVVSSFHYVSDTAEELPWHTPQLSDYQAMSGRDAAKIFLTTLNIEGFSWNKLIRREILVDNHIRFDESMNSFVDMYGMFRVILNSERVSFYHARPYYYRQHNISCVHTMSLRKLDNYKKVISQITGLAKENDMENEGVFFHQYRMTLQLFDFIRNKGKYSADIWKQFKKEYQWNNIFDQSLCAALKIIFSYLKDNRLKVAVKLIWVWSCMSNKQ